MDSINQEMSSLKRRMEHLENVKAKRSRCRTVVEEAICFLTTGHMKLEEVLKHFEGLGSNRDFWIAYVNAKEFLSRDVKDVDACELLLNYASNALLDDKELVVQYLSKLDRMSRSEDDETAFDVLSESFKCDEDVVCAFLDHSPYFFLTRHSSYVKKFPDLMAS
jgi:hypothetical protein